MKTRWVERASLSPPLQTICSRPHSPPRPHPRPRPPMQMKLAEGSAEFRCVLTDSSPLRLSSSVIKLLIIEALVSMLARNIAHVICSLPHHLSPPHPDDQELRLSPSQFPPGTIYPAATEGWMAPRPIASSGKLNITHIYPNTVTQQRGHKIQNRRTFEARKIDV